MNATLGPDVLDWIEKTVGPVTAATPHPAAGRSRSIWMIDTGPAEQARALILRADAGDGPLSATRFTLAREGQLFLAMNDLPVTVPRCYGVRDDGSMMLLDRVPGSASASYSSDAQRIKVMGSYLDELTRLHALDPQSVPLQWGHETPMDAPGLIDLAEYVAPYRRLCPPHADYDRVVEWLEANSPEVREERVVLHGDTGPGNFLHDGEQLTGLIDFEMAHIGDREDDLAWLWFRAEILNGDLSSGEYLAEYQRRSGHAIDYERFLYYRVLVLARCVATNLLVEGIPTDVVRAGLTKTLPWLRAVLVQAGGPDLGEKAVIPDAPTVA